MQKLLDLMTILPSHWDIEFNSLSEYRDIPKINILVDGVSFIIVTDKRVVAPEAEYDIRASVPIMDLYYHFQVKTPSDCLAMIHRILNEVHDVKENITIIDNLYGFCVKHEGELVICELDEEELKKCTTLILNGVKFHKE